METLEVYVSHAFACLGDISSMPCRSRLPAGLTPDVSLREEIALEAVGGVFVEAVVYGEFGGRGGGIGVQGGGVRANIGVSLTL